MAVIEDPERHESTALARMVPAFAGLRVLEIGCGDGRVTHLFANTAKSVVAIDPDADAIAELRDVLPNVDARAIGIADLVMPAHSVDVVIFSWSL